MKIYYVFFDEMIYFQSTNKALSFLAYDEACKNFSAKRVKFVVYQFSSYGFTVDISVIYDVEN